MIKQAFACIQWHSPNCSGVLLVPRPLPGFSKEYSVSCLKFLVNILNQLLPNVRHSLEFDNLEYDNAVPTNFDRSCDSSFSLALPPVPGTEGEENSESG